MLRIRIGAAAVTLGIALALSGPAQASATRAQSEAQGGGGGQPTPPPRVRVKVASYSLTKEVDGSLTVLVKVTSRERACLTTAAKRDYYRIAVFAVLFPDATDFNENLQFELPPYYVGTLPLHYPIVGTVTPTAVRGKVPGDLVVPYLGPGRENRTAPVSQATSAMMIVEVAPLVSIHKTTHAYRVKSARTGEPVICVGDEVGNYGDGTFRF